jgi:hypothetical protein
MKTITVSLEAMKRHEEKKKAGEVKKNIRRDKEASKDMSTLAASRLYNIAPRNISVHQRLVAMDKLVKGACDER